MREKSNLQIYYELLKLRRPLDKEELTFYHAILRGYHGECIFDDYVDTTLGSSFNYLTNLTFQFNRTTQVDSLLITDDIIYLFEIKNYFGNLTWDGKNWQYDNGRILNDDPIIQVSRSQSVLKNLVTSLGYQGQVKPVIVFINPDAYVNLQSEPPLTILRSFEVRQFLEKLKAHDHFKTRASNQICQELLKYQIKDELDKFLPINAHDHDKVPYGVVCPQCGNTNLLFTSHHVKCQCGFTEKKGDSLLRTIKEAQILLPHFEIKRKNIREFTKGVFAESTLSLFIKKMENYE